MCGICPSGCGVNVHLKDGKIERMVPLKNHPQGIVCPRGTRAKEIVYSKDRLLYPQRRIGSKGSGEYERITWDQAYDILVDKLHHISKHYGPEAVCTYTGRGNFEFSLNEAFAPSGTVESSANAVLFPFGSPNTTGVGALCYVSYGMIAPRACFGDYIRNMFEDLENAELIVVWGWNPATASPPSDLKRLRKAKRRGARLIVIDHRRSETARATDAEWIGIRPGTDGALALGAIQTLIAENLFDRNFVENWTHGFDELREYVQDFTPERVEAITGVPAHNVRDLGRSIGLSRACSIRTYSGLEYSNSGVQAIRAVLTLQALGGHLDAPGGKLFQMKNRLRLNRLTTPQPPNARPPIGADEYPIYSKVRNEAHAIALPRAIIEGDPYPVRAMLISGSSILTSWPNPSLWREALSALDYLVVINRFPTADSQYADLILPATTGFEIESYMKYDGYVQIRQRVIEPIGEARSDYMIFVELANRLGYGKRWPQSESALIEYALACTDIKPDELRAHPVGIQTPPVKMSYHKYERGELRADGRPGFETPTGKYEIASEWLRSYGYDALPVYTEPKEGPLGSPELLEKYPLVFNSGARIQSDFRSQHHNIPSLISLQPYPMVHIHEEDALARGIKNQDEVFVISPRGKIAMRANVTRDIVRGVVEANMGGV